MAQVSYGSITITDTTDVERIYMVYAGSSSSTTSPDKNTFSIWKENLSAVTGDYIWQRTVVKMSGIEITESNFQNYYGDPVCITGPEGTAGRNITSVTQYYYLSTSDTEQTGGSWDTTVPSYPSTGTYYYWIKTVTTYDTGRPSETTPALDGALNTANANAAQALADSQALRQHFWSLSEADGSTPAGVYITRATDTSFKSNANGANVYMTPNMIKMRQALYNQIVLQTATENNEGPYLRLYVPSGSSQGKLSVELNGNTSTLTLYKMDTNNTPAATLSGSGLYVSSGGVRGGDNNHSIYLSTTNYNSDVSINGTSLNTWRLLIDDKFGVTDAGALYAADVNVKGVIKADTGYIGGSSGWTITSGVIYKGTIDTDKIAVIDIDKAYLSTINLGGTIYGPDPTNTANDTAVKTFSKTDLTSNGWRLITGKYFGVDAQGKMYASRAEISGNFSATSLSTNGRTSATDGKSGVYMDSTGNIYAGGYTSGSNKYNKFYVEGSNLYLGGQEIGAIITNIATAATKATNFFGDTRTIDGYTGIPIAMSNPNTTSTFNLLHSGGMRVYTNSICVADFGATTTIGNQSNYYIQLNSNSINFKQGQTTHFTIDLQSNAWSENVIDGPALSRYGTTTYETNFEEIIMTNYGIGLYTDSEDNSTGDYNGVAYIDLQPFDGGSIRLIVDPNDEGGMEISPDGVGIKKGGIFLPHESSELILNAEAREVRAIYFGQAEPANISTTKLYHAAIGDIYIKY